MRRRHDDFLTEREPQEPRESGPKFGALILIVLGFVLAYNLFLESSWVSVAIIQLAPLVLILGIAIWAIRKRSDFGKRK